MTIGYKGVARKGPGMDVGSGELCPPWIFIYGTDIVDRGLVVLFFCLFFFCYFSVFFPLPPLPLEEAK